MRIQILEEGLLIRRADSLDLKQTLDCGQCFRFFPTADGGWHGVAGGRPLTLRETENGVLLEHTTRREFDEFWRDYFDLDRDYGAIRRGFPPHPALYTSAGFAPGMRILRQDAWETLIGFILSQNNNIPRIKGIVERLCRTFGRPCGENDYAFPSPAALVCLDERALAPLRCGWRADYVLDAARLVASGVLNLDKVAALPMEQARQALQTVRGVGPKVAECVLLYGMGRLEAFPLDVWMKRAMAALFPGMTPQSFGPYAGIAQQYIFHYCRCNPSCCRPA